MRYPNKTHKKSTEPILDLLVDTGYACGTGT